MKRVIMTIGPQYAGKSTFCQKVIAAYPKIVFVSRDAILIEMYGTVWLDAYSGGHFAAWERLWQMVTKHLTQEGVTLLVDAWNGPRADRADMLKKFRAAGASRVDAWYFVTPLDVCTQWSFLRDPVEAKSVEWLQIKQKSRISDYRYDYERYHSQKIESEQGFDSIKRIDALEPPLIESILLI